MATKPKGGKIEPKQEKPVSRAEFEALANGVNDLVGLIKSGALSAAPAATPEEAKEAKEVAKAGPAKVTTNPEWDDIAREIIGEAVDYTETIYLKGGGLYFAIIIKQEFSNAPADYLERTKVDRRGREVGAEGEAGVRIWCTQVRDNLKKPKPMTS